MIVQIKLLDYNYIMNSSIVNICKIAMQYYHDLVAKISKHNVPSPSTHFKIDYRIEKHSS